MDPVKGKTSNLSLNDLLKDTSCLKQAKEAQRRKNERLAASAAVFGRDISAMDSSSDSPFISLEEHSEETRSEWKARASRSRRRRQLATYSSTPPSSPSPSPERKRERSRSPVEFVTTSKKDVRQGTQQVAVRSHAV
ncbi:hypothetical protein, partial [Sansalvadorimonas verongulae]|uniref:hypothetical protein n=1 Tax=Sansalvadorimonas verongulae TaxID=2172824 RepID=UPI0018AD250D